MKTARKSLLIALCAVLLVVASVMGTLAYLTSEANDVVNTFTVGNVKITLDEAKVTEYGVKDGESRVQANTYKLIPGHNYVKDPTVHVDSLSEDAWLFVKVTNGISAIEKAGDTTIAKQMEANWEVINEAKGIYAYKRAVTKADVDVVVFSSFTLADNADVASYKDASITIEAYAVQKDTLASAQAAWDAAPLTAWTE